jgi:hypothetical protein
MKSKFVFGLLAAMLVLALAPNSFAQINITINNVPSPQEVQTNRTAETSDPTSFGAGITVSGALIAQSGLTVTTLTLTFPSTITTRAAFYAAGGSVTPVPAGDPIRIEGATGIFAAATLWTQTSTTLQISLPSSADNTASGSFRIIGVRILGDGLTAPANATASLSSSANNYFLSTSTVPLISALGPGIASVTQGAVSGGTNLTTVQIFTNQTVTDTTASAVITEGFASAWRTAAQNQIDAPGAAGVGASQIRLTVAGIPAGVTLSYTVSYPSGQASVVGASTGSFTSSATTSTLTISAGSLSTVESIQLNFTATGTPTSTPATGSITLTATMAPNPASGASSTALNSTTPVPTYSVAEVGPATIGSIVAANTTMLLPYALRQGAFDTGIAIANTTADAFGATAGGATPTAGNLIFDFFPRNPAGGAGTPFQLSTSSSTVFGGLSADGTLAAGGTFVALLSEILSRTSFTGDFSGYIFIRANFLGAHGTATISDFRTFSLAATVLLLPPPASNSRNSPAGGVEALNN